MKQSLFDMQEIKGKIISVMKTKPQAGRGLIE